MYNVHTLPHVYQDCIINKLDYVRLNRNLYMYYVHLNRNLHVHYVRLGRNLYIHYVRLRPTFGDLSVNLMLCNLLLCSMSKMIENYMELKSFNNLMLSFVKRKPNYSRYVRCRFQQDMTSHLKSNVIIFKPLLTLDGAQTSVSDSQFKIGIGHKQ